MRAELKPNDPVMWKKTEYRFVKYGDEPNGCWITKSSNKSNVMRYVLRDELDLILEFDICKTLS
tara:strand:+ start:222 stop:413 length:192 start_codon:yes stop_codon:yes gene_type:complete